MTARGRLLLTGATGFIGSAVLRVLAERLNGSAHRPGCPDPGALAAPARGLPRPRPVVPAPRVEGRPPRPRHLTALVRQFPDPGSRGWQPGVEFCAGDLTDVPSLRAACEGADTLVHCASYVGGDAAACEAVNAQGTRDLLAAAERAGVRRVLYVSTTAVYGPGPHRGLSAQELPPAPASPTSRSRLAAEQAVLAAGGTVLRAPFVLGPGDKWVVPALAELLHRVPALPAEGRALLSFVAVDDLAALLTELALSPDDLTPGIQHAAHPDPVPLHEFAALLTRHLGLAAPTASLTAEQYLDRVRDTPGRVTPHQARMLTEDRWYRTEAWQTAGTTPGPGTAIRLAEYAGWYRGVLTPRAHRVP
ncbi:NAD-dependent epimerase/dehydratase family protein [Streptomyces physcomitrii]|uniref:NAD-dependent epimerase/dehydratase family protein n=1 Tax=Streptomyces physcomitrii TaxID=2724184 RepID=A0ABX1HAW0_9ACTN|nr:NAD-dependent epimerase/dehydratase family protein [Streptomyces physcomitrii]NKI44374.1 NAD-dependent epimerase/dehydratase family protein [Streptomyces physcomitrii]